MNKVYKKAHKLLKEGCHAMRKSIRDKQTLQKKKR